MNITNYGHFNASVSNGILIHTNGDGQDWYEMQRGEAEGVPQLVVLGSFGVFISSIHPVWAMVDPQGVVTNVEFDPSRMVPVDKTIIGVDGVAFQDVRPGMIYENGQLVEPPPPPPVPYSLPVSTLWARMTDDEAEEFDAAMATASPLRLRKAFNAASQLYSDTELFSFTRGVLVGAVGEDRAGNLMAA